MTPLVMVVEDDPVIRHMLEYCLDTICVDVIAAGDGSEALDLLESNSPAVILLDMHMPGMDGETFLQHLAIRNLSHIPVIISSGDRDYRRQSAGTKLFGFIEKPFELSELYRVIERALNIKVQRRVSDRRKKTGRASAHTSGAVAFEAHQSTDPKPAAHTRIERRIYERRTGLH